MICKIDNEEVPTVVVRGKRWCDLAWTLRNCHKILAWPCCWEEVEDE